MAQDKNDTFRTDEKSTTETGSDIPGGDGTISDEDMNAISGRQTRENGTRPFDRKPRRYDADERSRSSSEQQRYDFGRGASRG